MIDKMTFLWLRCFVHCSYCQLNFLGFGWILVWSPSCHRVNLEDPTVSVKTKISKIKTVVWLITAPSLQPQIVVMYFFWFERIQETAECTCNFKTCFEGELQGWSYHSSWKRVIQIFCYTTFNSFNSSPPPSYITKHKNNGNEKPYEMMF